MDFTDPAGGSQKMDMILFPIILQASNWREKKNHLGSHIIADLKKGKLTTSCLTDHMQTKIHLWFIPCLVYQQQGLSAPSPTHQLGKCLPEEHDQKVIYVPWQNLWLPEQLYSSPIIHPNCYTNGISGMHYKGKLNVENKEREDQLTQTLRKLVRTRDKYSNGI